MPRRLHPARGRSASRSAQVADYTGKLESDNSGRKVTPRRRADGDERAFRRLACSSWERFDTSVAEMELKYANNKLIGGEDAHGPGEYRKIFRGLDSRLRLLSCRRHHPS